MPKVFYATTHKNGRPSNASIVMPSDGKEPKRFTDPRTGLQLIDPSSVKTIIFVGGVYKSLSATEDAYLEAFSKNFPNHLIQISSEPAVKKSKDDVIVKTVSVLPAKFAKTMDRTALAEALKDTFDYVAIGSSVQDIIDEATEKGYIK